MLSCQHLCITAVVVHPSRPPLPTKYTSKQVFLAERKYSNETNLHCLKYVLEARWKPSYTAYNIHYQPTEAENTTCLVFGMAGHPFGPWWSCHPVPWWEIRACQQRRCLAPPKSSKQVPLCRDVPCVPLMTKHHVVSRTCDSTSPCLENKCRMSWLDLTGPWR